MRARLFITSSFLWLNSYLWLDLTANLINTGCISNIPKNAFLKHLHVFKLAFLKISLLDCIVVRTTWTTWESAFTSRWKSFNPLTKSWHELLLSALTYLESHNRTKHSASTAVLLALYTTITWGSVEMDRAHFLQWGMWPLTALCHLSNALLQLYLHALWQ